MRLAVYSLTRDRLDLTVECFEQFWSLGLTRDVELRHFVVDNGSEDDSPNWLTQRQRDGVIAWLTCLPCNVGIHGGESVALGMIASEENQTGEPFDVVVKLDNDCYVDPGAVAIVARTVKAAHVTGESWVLSPVITGLGNSIRLPDIRTTVAGMEVAELGHIGGICRCSPRDLAIDYEPDMGLPKAWGQDEDYSLYARAAGARLGYVDGVEVHHARTTAGQADLYPEYFERKYREEGSRDPQTLARRTR